MRPIIASAMFHLTRRERVLIAAVLLAFVTGAAVKHIRQSWQPAEETPAHSKHADNRF